MTEPCIEDIFIRGGASIHPRSRRGEFSMISYQKSHGFSRMLGELNMFICVTYVSRLNENRPKNNTLSRLKFIQKKIEPLT